MLPADVLAKWLLHMALHGLACHSVHRTRVDELIVLFVMAGL